MVDLLKVSKNIQKYPKVSKCMYAQRKHLSYTQVEKIKVRYILLCLIICIFWILLDTFGYFLLLQMLLAAKSKLITQKLFNCFPTRISPKLKVIHVFTATSHNRDQSNYGRTCPFCNAAIVSTSA